MDKHFQTIRQNPAQYGDRAMAKWPDLQPVQWQSINGDHEALAKHLSGVYGRDMTAEVDAWARQVTGAAPASPMTTQDVPPQSNQQAQTQRSPNASRNETAAGKAPAGKTTPPPKR